jgi:hypothetical protein
MAKELKKIAIENARTSSLAAKRFLELADLVHELCMNGRQRQPKAAEKE